MKKNIHLFEFLCLVLSLPPPPSLPPDTLTPPPCAYPLTQSSWLPSFSLLTFLLSVWQKCGVFLKYCCSIHPCFYSSCSYPQFQPPPPLPPRPHTHPTSELVLNTVILAFSFLFLLSLSSLCVAEMRGLLEVLLFLTPVFLQPQ